MIMANTPLVPNKASNSSQNEWMLLVCRFSAGSAYALNPNVLSTQLHSTPMLYAARINTIRYNHAYDDLQWARYKVYSGIFYVVVVINKA